MSIPLVLIHGWGQTAACWQRIPCANNALKLSLPGHVDAKDVAADDWVDALLAQLPDRPVCLVGWSLGGQIAMQISLRAAERVQSLVLLATTPCFMQQPDWRHGVDPVLLHGYQTGIHVTPSKILRRFHTLMFNGETAPHAPVLKLPPVATSQALLAGLSLLERWDLRHNIASIQCPVWLLHGEQDTVVSPEAGRFLARKLPHVQATFMADASHALPWTQPQAIEIAIHEACYV